MNAYYLGRRVTLSETGPAEYLVAIITQFKSNLPVRAGNKNNLLHDSNETRAKCASSRVAFR